MRYLQMLCAAFAAISATLLLLTGYTYWIYWWPTFNMMHLFGVVISSAMTVFFAFLCGEALNRHTALSQDYQLKVAELEARGPEGLRLHDKAEMEKAKAAAEKAKAAAEKAKAEAEAERAKAAIFNICPPR